MKPPTAKQRQGFIDCLRAVLDLPPLYKPDRRSRLGLAVDPGNYWIHATGKRIHAKGKLWLNQR